MDNSYFVYKKKLGINLLNYSLQLNSSRARYFLLANYIKKKNFNEVNVQKIFYYIIVFVTV